MKDEKNLQELGQISFIFGSIFSLLLFLLGWFSRPLSGTDAIIVMPLFFVILTASSLLAIGLKLIFFKNMTRKITIFLIFILATIFVSLLLT